VALSRGERRLRRRLLLPLVIKALAFARAQDVTLSVRSGGHGLSGRSTNDGGTVIYLSGMNKVEVLDREITAAPSPRVARSAGAGRRQHCGAP
jgi:FAD/FMN-containing dehydrogenase